MNLPADGRLFRSLPRTSSALLTGTPMPVIDPIAQGRGRIALHHGRGNEPCMPVLAFASTFPRCVSRDCLPMRKAGAGNPWENSPSLEKMGPARSGSQRTGKRMLPMHCLAADSGSRALSVFRSDMSHWRTADTFDVIGTKTPTSSLRLVPSRSARAAPQNMVTGHDR